MTETQVMWPASSPHVTGIGGTTLTVKKSGSSYIYSKEVVWKDGTGLPPTGMCSGGGSSTLFSKPSWQAGKGVPSSNQRHVPDVSLDADTEGGYAVAFNGYWYSCGGTTASSAALAGFFASVNQQRKAAGKGYLGQVNAALYDLFRTKASTVLHDVTSGNNVDYKAQSGYDRCTGVGTIRGDTLARP